MTPLPHITNEESHVTKLNYAKITPQKGKIANKNDFKAKTQRELGSTIRTKSKLK
jgi:hypothetical protein